MYEQRKNHHVQELPPEYLANSLRISGDVEIMSGEHRSTLKLERTVQHGPRGTYCQNNGVIAFITDQGDYRVALYSRGLSDALRSAGYKEGEIFVPFSNGEVPVVSPLRARWAEVCESCRQLYKAEREAEALAGFSAAADERGIARGVGTKGDFWNVDGVPYRNATGKEMRFQPTPIDDVASRTEQVGYYCCNGGLVALVDESGRMFVGAPTEKNIALLQSHGYDARFIFVPFSNGERPVDPWDSGRLRQLLSPD